MCGDLADENVSQNIVLSHNILPDSKVCAKGANGGDKVGLPDLQPFLLHHLLHSFDDGIVTIVNLYKAPDDGEHLLLCDSVNVKCQPARDCAEEGWADPVILEFSEDAENIQNVPGLQFAPILHAALF